MKKSLVFYITTLLIILSFSACTGGGAGEDPYANFETTRQFYAVKVDGSNEVYQLTANLLAVGDHVAVYAEQGSGVTEAEAHFAADEFDQKIHGTVRTYFGTESDVDSNGRIILLLLDIIDGFTGSGGYVAGYFDAYDLFDFSDSNKADMIYVDTYPGDPADETFYRTIAHEYQHLVNFNEKSLKQGVSMDTWINEGMSLTAEYLYLGTHSTSRISYYNLDSQKSIRRGNNFFVWDNDNDVLADYATAYIFFQWLRMHASNGAGIFKEIIGENTGDFQAVLTNAQEFIPTFTGSTWQDLLSSWYTALYYKDTSGLYGFNDEFLLVKHNYDQPGGTAALLPGEGIFDEISSPFTPSPFPSDILYFGMGSDSNTIDTTDPYDGDFLFAVNIDPDKDGSEVNTPISTSSVSATHATMLDLVNASYEQPEIYPIEVRPGNGIGRGIVRERD